MLGDATYNNVYGNGTTGDITRSMRASGSGAAGEAGERGQQLSLGVARAGELKIKAPCL